MFALFLDLTAAAPAPSPAVVAPASICDEPLLDLDGDGARESFREVPDSRGTGGAVYDLYLGTRKIGEVRGCWWLPGEKRHYGLRDFVAIWRGGCCDYGRIYYRFDGRRYREVAIRAGRALP